jgi:hypothetical protein
MSMSYTPRTWADALLGDLDAPDTPTNEQTIVDWEASEGGAGPQWGIPGNVTDYNPLNVSLTTGAQGYGYDPGTGEYFAGATPTPGNNPPIAAFSDWGTGLEATVARLEEPFASGILGDLRAGDSEATIAGAVGASGWGTGDFATRNAPGTASGSGPAGPSSSGSSPASASLTGAFGIPGVPGFLDPATDAEAAAAEIWSVVEPFLAKGMLIATGLGLIGLGLYKVTDAGPKLSGLFSGGGGAAEALAA